MNAVTTGATVSIAMHRDLSTGEWFVESVNYRFGQIRNVTTFAAPMPLFSAFTADFFAFLQDHLPRNANPQVVSLSDCTVQVGKLVLSGLRMMAQKVSCGRQKVIIRFQEVFGAIHHFFAERHRPGLVAPSAPALASEAPFDTTSQASNMIAPTEAVGSSTTS